MIGSIQCCNGPGSLGEQFRTFDQKDRQGLWTLVQRARLSTSANILPLSRPVRLLPNALIKKKIANRLVCH